MKILVPFSGGKDSQATLLWAAEKHGKDRITAVFCDTKWENPITYEHIKYVVDKIGCPYVSLVSKKFDGMVDLATKKKRFPSTKAKFCTTELKVIPMIDYILSLNTTVYIIQGIRADESEARSLMSKQCTFFKYYFQPYITNTMIIDKFELIKTKKELTEIQKEKLQKAIYRKALGFEDAKFHTYRKKDVKAFCKQYGDDIIRPFFDATADEVISYSLNRDYKINPLYFKGFSRVGCFPCIMCTQGEIDLIVKSFPETIANIKLAEETAGHTFFPPDKIPVRYRSHKTKDGKTFADIDDVVRYSNDKKATGDLFENDDEVNGCKSVYSICE